MNPVFLGARFLSAGTQAGFRVFAPRATRVEVWIYAVPAAAPPILAQAMSTDASGAWVFTAGMAALQAVGLQGSIYYGYRAWGPN